MNWCGYTNENGQPETRGTEGGTIIVDEEHDFGARITLERLGEGPPCAITCGIYGWMVHTRFFAEAAAAERDYAAMKARLAEIVEQIPLKSDPEVEKKMLDVADAMSAFVDQFP